MSAQKVDIESDGDLPYTGCSEPSNGSMTRRMSSAATRMEIPMNEETLNLSIRKFLKIVGISSQREIERAVTRALQEGLIAGAESFPAQVTLEVPGLNLSVKFDGEIRLE